MSNMLLKQILGGVLGQAMARRGGAGGGFGTPMGGGMGGGGLGGVFGGGGNPGGLGGIFGGGGGLGGGPGGVGGRGGGMAGGGLGGLGGGLGGAALGSVLGGMLGRGGLGRGGAGGGLGGRGALIALVLPLAMRWIQQNGGLGAVLKRFQDKGYARHASSWVAPGENEPIAAADVDEVVGREELSRLSQQLGVPQQEVSQAFADILPELVDQVTPEGQLRPDADDILQDGRGSLEEQLQELQKGRG